MTAVLDLYAAGLGGDELRVRDRDGDAVTLPVARWVGPLDAADHEALDRADGPVLDVGCGPGRHVAALQRRGVAALGVDVSPAAVALARGRGARVIQADVFTAVPRAGAWGSALLLDGNVGIGGDPHALLGRLRELLRPAGRVVAELAPPGTPTGVRQVRLEGPLGRSGWFAWGALGVDDVDAVAASSGYAVTDLWRCRQRWFATLDACAAR